MRRKGRRVKESRGGEEEKESCKREGDLGIEREETRGNVGGGQ